jgi:hypothetical protein
MTLALWSAAGPASADKPRDHVGHRFGATELKTQQCGQSHLRGNTVVFTMSRSQELRVSLRVSDAELEPHSGTQEATPIFMGFL